MRQIIIVITVIFFFSGCDSDKGHKRRISEQKNKIKRLTDYKNILEKKIDSLSLVNQRYKNQIKFLRSPKNKKILSVWPSGWEHEYLCYDNHKVIHDIAQHYAYIGSWEISDDSLRFHFTKKAGKRGIGEPHKTRVAKQTTSAYRYDEYVPYCEIIDKKETYDWDKLSREIILKMNSSDDSNEAGFVGFNEIESNEALKKYDIKLHGRFSFASKRPLTKDELNDYSKRELRIMRNEIFARYGYIFNTKDIKTYFNKKKWYEPSKNNIDKYLSDLEKDNIKLIKEIEEK